MFRFKRLEALLVGCQIAAHPGCSPNPHGCSLLPLLLHGICQQHHYWCLASFYHYISINIFMYTCLYLSMHIYTNIYMYTNVCFHLSKNILHSQFFLLHRSQVLQVGSFSPLQKVFIYKVVNIQAPHSL